MSLYRIVRGTDEREYLASFGDGGKWVRERADAMRVEASDRADAKLVGGRVVRIVGLGARRCEQISNVLTGVNMHLTAIAAKNRVDIDGPLAQIEALAKELEEASGHG